MGKKVGKIEIIDNLVVKLIMQPFSFILHLTA